MGGEWWVWNSDLCISPDCKIIHKINLIPRPCGMDGNEASVNYVHFKVFGYILSQHTDIICTRNSCTLQVGVVFPNFRLWHYSLVLFYLLQHIHSWCCTELVQKNNIWLEAHPPTKLLLNITLWWAHTVDTLATRTPKKQHSTIRSLGIIVNIELYWVCRCTEWIMWHVPLFAVWRHYTHICGAWQLHRGIPSWVQSTYLQGSPTVYTVRIQIESQLARSCWSRLCWGFTQHTFTNRTVAYCCL